MSKTDVTGRRKLTDDERKSLDAMFSEFFTGEDGVELSRTFKSQDGTEFSVDQFKNKCREQ